jgi:hypothetical protein
MSHNRRFQASTKMQRIRKSGMVQGSSAPLEKDERRCGSSLEQLTALQRSCKRASPFLVIARQEGIS